MEYDKNVIAIITGMERSGTTVLHNLINSHSQITSGFECAILLGTLKTFETIDPFAMWLKNNRYQFGLPSNYLDDIKNMTYKEVYQYINKNKGSYEGNFQNIMKNSEYFIDKAPRYIYELEEVIQKIKGIDIPIIIILKNFNNIYFSSVIKRNQNINEFTENIKKCIKTLELLEKNNYSYIYLLYYNDVIFDKKVTAAKLIKILKKYTPKLKEEILSIEKWNIKTKVDEENELYPYRYWRNIYLAEVEIPDNLKQLEEQYNNLLFKLKMDI